MGNGVRVTVGGMAIHAWWRVRDGMWVTADHTVDYATWVTVCGWRYVGDSVWVTVCGYVTGCVMVRFRAMLRCVTVVRYADALRRCVTAHVTVRHDSALR